MDLVMLPLRSHEDPRHEPQPRLQLIVNNDEVLSRKDRLKRAVRKTINVCEAILMLSYAPFTMLQTKNTLTSDGTAQYISTPAAKAMAALQSSYNPLTGLWDNNGWWQSANIIETVAMNAVETNNYSFTQDISNTFKINNRNHFVNQYEDDNGWWAITWLSLYKLTNYKPYLQTSEVLFKNMANSWNETCGGGIVWDTQIPSPSKGAISNELFLEAAAMLYTATQNKYYSNWMYKAYNWLTQSGMITNSNLVTERLDANCKPTDRTSWTYLQGVMVGALIAVSTATNNSIYTRQGEAIATANDNYNIDSKGILTEKACCYGGSSSFKGMYIKNLYALYNIDHKQEYRNFIQRNANAILKHDMGKENNIGYNWDGPLKNTDSVTQAAGVDVLSAAQALNAKRN